MWQRHMRKRRFTPRPALAKVANMNNHPAPTSAQPASHAAQASWQPSARQPRRSVRVLLIPGLRDSGPAHWQTWLQGQYVDAVRVQQHDWHRPDLEAWSARIEETLSRHSRHTQWVAVAHSFGTLALAHHIATRQMAHADSSSALGDATGVGLRHGRIVAALMVAPADPVKFELEERLPRHRLDLPLSVIGSENDPWMPLERARDWAHTWGAGFRNLGQAGHINTESGFGPWPLARQKVDELIRRQLRQEPCLCAFVDTGGTGGMGCASDAARINAPADTPQAAGIADMGGMADLANATGRACPA
jgi:predicted alpha/beta hydrolase family esterase